MQPAETKEMAKPAEASTKITRDVVKDGAQEVKGHKASFSQEDEINSIVNSVVHKAKISIPTDGLAHNRVEEDQRRIEKAGEIWRDLLKKKVARREKMPANLFGGDPRKITPLECKETLEATLDYYRSSQRRLLHPGADITKKQAAVRQLCDVHQELEKEERSLITRYNHLKSTKSHRYIDVSKIKTYIEEKINGLLALQTELDHPAEQREHVGLRISTHENIKTKVDKDIKFWEAVHKLHETTSGEYIKVEKDTMDCLERITTKEYIDTLNRVKNALNKIGVDKDIIKAVEVDKERAIQAIEANVRECYSTMGAQDQMALLRMAAKTRSVIEADFVDPDYHNDMNDVRKMQDIRYNDTLNRVKNALNKIGVDEDVIKAVEVNKERAIQAIDANVRERYSTMGDQDQKALLRMAAKTRSVIEADFVDPDHPYSVYNRQHGELVAVRYSYHRMLARIQDEANEARKLTEDADKQRFIKDMKPISSGLEATLFKELVERHTARRSVERHTARRSALNNGLTKNIPSWHFDASMWHHDPKWQEDNTQYTHINAPHLDDFCVSISLTRIVSTYLPQITSTSQELQKKVEEIYHLDYTGSKRNFTNASDKDANYLNTELAEGRLNIPMPEGKEVRYKVLRGSGYVNLDKFMSIKDKNENYIPIMISVGLGPNENAPGGFAGHRIVLHKQGDLYDEQGQHYPDFVVHNPYIPIKPVNKYALDDLLEKSYAQQKERSYAPGHMGPWRIVVPIEVAVGKKPTGSLDSKAIASKFLHKR